MFSRRSSWDRTPNRFSELLATKRRDGAALIDLTTSNPTRCGLDHPPSTVLATLQDPAALRYTPTAQGDLVARQAISTYYQDRGVELSPERLFLTASTSEAYALAFKLLADPGDDVLAPRPSYPLFDYLARLEDVALTPYALDNDGGWRLDMSAIDRAIKPTSRAILVVSPNNPTGSVASGDELRELDARGGERQLAIICDEVFADFTFDDQVTVSVAAAIAHESLTLSLSGLSKVAGLPQMKLAWIALGGPQLLVEEAIARLELIADTYLSVATPIQYALPELLRTRHAFQIACRKRLRANRDAIVARLRSAPEVTLLTADGGWYACLRVPRVLTEEQLIVSLLEDDVIVHPGYFFDFPNEAFLVVSLLTAEDELARGLERIVRRLGRPS